MLAQKYQRSIIHMKIQTSPLENENGFLSKLERGQGTNLILSDVENLIKIIMFWVGSKEGESGKRGKLDEKICYVCGD